MQNAAWNAFRADVEQERARGPLTKELVHKIAETHGITLTDSLAESVMRPPQPNEEDYKAYVISSPSRGWGRR